MVQVLFMRTADEDREVSPEEMRAFFEANKYRTNKMGKRQI